MADWASHVGRSNTRGPGCSPRVKGTALDEEKNREVLSAGYCYRGRGQRRRRCDRADRLREPIRAQEQKLPRRRGTRWQIDRCLKLGESHSHHIRVAALQGNSAAVRTALSEFTYARFICGKLKPVFPTMEDPILPSLGASHGLTGSKGDFFFFLMFRFARKKKLKNRLTVVCGPGFVPRLSCFSHVCTNH